MTREQVALCAGYYINWIICLCTLQWNFHIVISQPCNLTNVTNHNLPGNWPCGWNNGEIPFVFNFYSTSPKRLMSLVNKGISYIEERSCLRFRESSPEEVARKQDYTYLYYTYSEVLENCCLAFFTKPKGRRVVLITPTCISPSEVAHVTLHALGINHKKNESFTESDVKYVLFSTNCYNYEEKLQEFYKIT